MKTTITLDNLKLRMWKGVRDFVLDAQGRDVKIYGDNATGKTTLADGWYWLLFDEDSNSQSQFDIKTLDKNNEPIHGVEHEIEGILGIGNKKVSLKKIYKEKWTKKRGSVKEVFSGHTTDYYIDDVPKKAGEYTDYIAGIINEKTFKLLTIPRYFNEKLHWEERRKTLLEVCGNVSDQDVIASNKKLNRLKDIIKNRSLDDHKKVIVEQRKKINKELPNIQVRIDEVMKGLPDISEISPNVINPKVQSLKAEKKEKEQELTRIESGGEIAEKSKKLAEIETVLEEIKRKHKDQYFESISNSKMNLRSINEQIYKIDRNIKLKEKEVNNIGSEIAGLELEVNKLRQKWHEADEREINVDNNCPTCGQDLPDKQIKDAYKNANYSKAQELENINIKGKKIVKKINELKSEDEKNRKEIVDLKIQADNQTTLYREINSEIEKLEDEAERYQNDLQYKKKVVEKEVLQKAIISLQEDNQDAITKVKLEIESIEEKIQTLGIKLSFNLQYNQGLERIEELKTKEKKLAAMLEKLEEELYLVEEFTRTRVGMLTEKINARFKLARFKLFSKQINGGLEECCEALVNGVPYSTNLNSGAKTNVDIDIINTLSKHYNFHAPIFIDNAESVTEIMKSDSQMIKLVVSKKDKKLRVERDDS